MIDGACLSIRRYRHFRAFFSDQSHQSEFALQFFLLD